MGERPLRQPSAELLGQCDDDALGAADVTEPIAVLVLLQLANEFGAVGVQAGKDVLNVFDGEHDATYAQRVRRCVFRLSADRRRRVELRQLKPAVAVRDSKNPTGPVLRFMSTDWHAFIGGVKDGAFDLS